MFDHLHCVPILKSKRGEHRAIEQLDPAARRGLTPLFEVPFIQPYKLNPLSPKDDPQTIEEQIEKTARYLIEYWFDDKDPRKEGGETIEADEYFSGHRPVFVDLRMLKITECADRTHPFLRLRDATIDEGARIIPVTGLRREGRYQYATREVFRSFGEGVMLRFEEEDFERDMEKAVDSFLKFYDILPSSVDVMLDLKGISGAMQARYGALGMIGDIPRLQDWRTFTLASAGFPEDFPAEDGETKVTSRYDWKVWSGVIQSGPSRLPSYADYGVRGREVPTMEVPVSPNPKFVYTDDEDWVVSKKSKNGSGYGSFIDICRELVGAPVYRGPGYSSGDAQIDDYVNVPSEGPGNGESWIVMSVNHHLTLVVDQLSNLRAPSGGRAQP